MASSKPRSQLGQVLIDFSTNGAFPEEEAVSAAYAEPSALPSALVAVRDAKAALEVEIRQISRDKASSVDIWITHAKTIQNDIDKSRKLANAIVREAEADEERLDGLKDKENTVEFLTKEVAFSASLRDGLKAIQVTRDRLRDVEKLAAERKIHEALITLEDAWTAIANIKLDKTARPIRILDAKWFELRTHIKEQLLDVWNSLVHCDTENNVVTIKRDSPDEPTTLERAVTGLKAYKELDNVVKSLAENLDNMILKPRTNLIARSTIPSVEITATSVSLCKNEADHTIQGLFVDLENVIQFLVGNLPSDIVQPLSNALMPTLSDRLLNIWLHSAVPSSLDEMEDYQKALSQVSNFATALDTLKWPGVEGLHEWVSHAPRIWLNKRRETALESTRLQLSMGLRTKLPRERVETRMVARDEGHLAVTSNTTANQDWDSAWDSDKDENNANGEKEVAATGNRHSFEEAQRVSEVDTPSPDEDVDDEAWGWGNDDIEPVAENTEPEPTTTTPETRQLTLSEKYWTSSLPQAVLDAVVGIYNDGAKLTHPESKDVPVTLAAPGLFGLPTLILALYRATSPHYYAKEPGGNMFLYNDAMWLSEQLRLFVSEWNKRPDLSPRAYGMVRLDNDIKVLESFGKRAYTRELNSQRTVISDLLGGSQNFFQQDGQSKNDQEANIDQVIDYIEIQHNLWNDILTPSASASATGSLVNAIAGKLIADIFDLSDIGVDEAESTATVLSRVEKLDDLFVQKSNNASKIGNGVRIPMTSQFADKWMKMKFLSEVLQSNLKEIKYLWFESDLSLYFTSDEVVELMNLSFQMNANVRAAIREIKENPAPRGEMAFD